MRVFIADDEQDILELYREVLHMCGHEIVGEARNGARAVDRILAMDPPPDLVLMDHRMPIKTGVEACAELLAARPQLRIVFISADRSVARTARELGATDFFNKPFTVNRLMQILDKAEQDMSGS